MDCNVLSYIVLIMAKKKSKTAKTCHQELTQINNFCGLLYSVHMHTLHIVVTASYIHSLHSHIYVCIMHFILLVLSQNREKVCP